MVTLFKIFSHIIMYLCSATFFFFGSVRFSKVQQICRLTMLYFYSHFHSFVDYSLFALKAEFTAFLSTQSLLVLFSGSCSLPGGSEWLQNKANSNRIRVDWDCNTPYHHLFLFLFFFKKKILHWQSKAQKSHFQNNWLYPVKGKVQIIPTLPKHPFKQAKLYKIHNIIKGKKIIKLQLILELKYIKTYKYFS